VPTRSAEVRFSAKQSRNVTAKFRVIEEENDELREGKRNV
jgi:hypothetical protein